MIKSIDFQRLGGYPLAQEDLDWLQVSYAQTFGALAGFIGDQVILSGMEEALTTVNAGWVVLDGKILPFEGGIKGLGGVAIRELKTPLIFQDGEQKDVLIDRLAGFSFSGPYNYNLFKRLGTISNIWQQGDIKDIIVGSQHLLDNFDATGLGRLARAGWGMMNGQGGRPNAQGRVLVNYDPGDFDFNQLGKIGGLKNVTLTIEQIPAHTHPYSAPLEYGDHDGGSSGYKRPNLPNNGTTGPRGGGQPHPNLQPYMVSLKIIKI